MSSQPKGQICRQTYFNYGSYLRARDNEKQLCTLITEIQNGTIIPYIVSNGGTIDGDLMVDGSLTVTGNLTVDGSLSYGGTVSMAAVAMNTLTITSDAAGNAPNLIINQGSAGAGVPTAVASGGSSTLTSPPSSNVAGEIVVLAWPNLGHITVTFGTPQPTNPLVFFTAKHSGLAHGIYLLALTPPGVFVLVNETGGSWAGSIHYFVVDLGA